ncbi:hypothetical protein [Pseudonocardia kongjuensis]|uniref:hypothetical protein n=1 Tax=Pseudonocardia kongjuensis TaxID=102227 RepID=UPI0031D345FA
MSVTAAGSGAPVVSTDAIAGPAFTGPALAGAEFTGPGFTGAGLTGAPPAPVEQPATSTSPTSTAQHHRTPAP